MTGGGAGGDLKVVWLAGACAGLANDTIIHPVDMVRANLQLSSASHLSRSPALAFAQLARAKLRAGGAGEFYKGISSVAMFAPVTYGLYFTAYKLVATRVEETYGGAASTPAAAYFVAGIAAECACNVFYVPYDVIKQQMQTSPASWDSAALVSMRRFRALGLRAGLYPGVAATLCTYSPFSGIYFVSYEGTRKWMERRSSGWGVPQAAREFAAAVLSGGVAAASTQPFDVVKTRIQVGQAQHGQGRFIQTLAHVVRTEGMGLFRGTVARVLTHAPACGLTMSLFESTCRRLGSE